MTKNKTDEFFDSQFKNQIQCRDFSINPFEMVAIDYLKGDILDLGCGLGNLALEAGRHGHNVVAVDSCDSAINQINLVAKEEGLSVEAIVADIETWNIAKSYDSIISIGLLMFFRRERAQKLLHAIQNYVNPGGRAIVNVLIEGTTYMEMFQSNHYYLFGYDELESIFENWQIVWSHHESFPATKGTVKKFSTLIAEKPN